jgi:hypothetical protein
VVGAAAVAAAPLSCAAHPARACAMVSQLAIHGLAGCDDGPALPTAPASSTVSQTEWQQPTVLFAPSFLRGLSMIRPTCRPL